MKKYLFVLAAVAAALLAVSCNKEQNAPEDPAQQEVVTSGEIVTIKATIPEEITKVVGEYSGTVGVDSKISLKWESGDEILINSKGFTIDDASISGDGKTATFSGPDPGAGPYNIVYDGISGTFVSQSQAEDGNTDHLQFGMTLSGVDTYEDISFTSSWATTHGGTCGLSSALHLQAKDMPAGSAAKVTSVVISSDNAIFDGTKSITVTIGTPGDAGSDGVLDIFAMLPVGNTAIPSGTTLLVKFNTNDASHSVYTRYHKTSGDLVFTGGRLNTIVLTCTNIDKHAGSTSCDGATEAKAFPIGDKYQMQAMRGLMATSSTTYFKLVDDIDLGGEDWIPLNYNDSYTRGIYFDGQNHTISNLVSYGDDVAPAGHTGYDYPSFVGVLNGTIKDVTFDGVTITAGENKAGAVGGYVGASEIIGHCEGVTVKNATISGVSYLGGFCGQVGHKSSTFSDCHVLGTNTITQNYATANKEMSTGGFVGHDGVGASYTDCTVKATITQGDGKTVNSIGGFIGKTDGSGSTLSCLRCEVLSGSSVTGNQDVGGFGGWIRGKGSFTNCSTAATVTGSANEIGGFTGGTYYAATFTNCTVTGNVSGVQYVGGFVGRSYNYATVFTECHVEGDVSSSCNADARVGGFVGQLGDPVTVKGCTVGTSLKKSKVSTVKPSASGKVLNAGGFVGVNYGTITKTDGGERNKAYVDIDCTNDEATWYLNLAGFAGFTRGTIEYSDADVDMSGLTGQRIGGFAGILTGNTSYTCTVDNCTVTGSVAGNHYTAGLIAAIDATEPIVTNNTVSCSVSGNSTVGGLVGVFGKVSGGGFTTDASLNGTFTGNTVSGTVSGVNNVGGIMGYCYGAATFIKNALTNNLTSTGAPVGGIVGYTDAAITITKCYVSGAITGAGNGVGGILGKTANSIAVDINNSYTTGNVTNGTASQQIVGGIVGDLGSTGSVTNCYATGSVSSGRVLGGIVGRAAKLGWNKSASDVDNTISGCIAFNPSVASLVTSVANQGSSGPIVGYTSIDNVMEKCYRISTMTFRNSNTYGDTLYDQDDCDGTNWVLGTTPGTYGDGDYSNQCSYHGKAAASGATVTEVARDVIGWSSSIWDFSGSLPTLK